MYLKRFIRFASCVMLLLAVASCVTGGQRPSSDIPRVDVAEDFQPAPATTKPFLPPGYTLGSGDELLITFLTLAGEAPARYTLQPGDIILAEFYGNEYLNRDLVIGPDGYVVVPYLGEISAAGKQLSALNAELTKEYKEQGFLTGTHLTLSLVRANSSYQEIQKFNTDGVTPYGRVVRVEMDGYIRLPLVGNIMVSGKTLDQVGDLVQDLYSKKFSTASVLVEIREIRSNLVYVLGYVNRPGMLNMTAPTTLSQAISQSGGFQETAGLDSVVVVRRGPDGKPQYALCDLDAVLTEGNMSNDIMLQRYDVIYVPPSTIHELNKAIQYGIRNMMPVHSTSVNAGFNYMYGPGSN